MGTTTPFALEYRYAGYSSGASITPGTTFYSSDGAYWADGSTFGAGDNIPIKVFASDSATCDDGNPCTTDTGTSGNCVHKPVSAGTVCRAAAGTCDVAEVCDGTAKIWPSDTFAKANSVCRAAVGACDVAKVCTGTSAACPSDAVMKQGTVCRVGAGSCDIAEECDGLSALCPNNKVLPAGTVRRPAAGPCDVAEKCDGAAVDCPADKLITGTVCRAAVGPCDLAEVCNGAGAACPADTFVNAGTTCRAAAGACDAAERKVRWRGNGLPYGYAGGGGKGVSCVFGSERCPRDVHRKRDGVPRQYLQIQNPDLPLTGCRRFPLPALKSSTHPPSDGSRAFAC